MTDELLSAKREKYPVNKGIGRPVEFKGLKAQYLFLFAGGLLSAFILLMTLLPRAKKDAVADTIDLG